MNYGQIRKYDVANGPGIRTSIFVTGCRHKCKGCFNQAYQDFSFGQPWTEKETEEVIGYLKLPEVAGLTLLGGEPMEHPQTLKKIVDEIKTQVSKSIWIYSGFCFEEIVDDPNKFDLLKECDVLVDGLFIEDQLDLRLAFRGSSNQRLIDIKKSLAAGQAVLWEQK